MTSFLAALLLVPGALALMIALAVVGVGLYAVTHLLIDAAHAIAQLIARNERAARRPRAARKVGRRTAHRGPALLDR